MARSRPEAPPPNYGFFTAHRRRYEEPPYQRNSETSRAAAASMKDRAPTLRDQVCEYIKSQGEHGATRDEMEVALDKRTSSINPRVAELSEEKRIYDSGRTRATRSGRMAVIWIAR